jgi:ATP-dependent DNA helicase DinG
VLLGTDSFWEGVDIRGEALRTVILFKLPFRPPNDPVTETLYELEEKKGGNPFMNLAVPEAVLKLKQGFGRLIRSRSDRGVVLFLDRRMVQKTYGKIFLESLPVESKQVRALPDEKIIEAASDFLNREPAK